MNPTRRFAFVVAMIAASAATHARAQLPTPHLAKRAVEIGYVHEWFQRDFGAELPAETDWSIGSVVISYGAEDWIALQVQGGIHDFGDEESYYARISLGAGITVRMLQSGVWSVSANTRYISTFDHDLSAISFHKGIDTLSGAVQLGATFERWGQASTVWAGPFVSHDDSDLYLWDAHQPIEASAGLGWGGAAGAHVVLFRTIAVYGYVTYVDDVAGGVGFALHAGKGSF
jgi:hypothetical protein